MNIPHPGNQSLGLFPFLFFIANNTAMISPVWKSLHTYVSLSVKLN